MKFGIINSKGRIDNDGASRARAYLSSDQLNLTNDTWTKVLLDAETYDNLGEFASYKFTATKAGYYLIHGSVTFVNAIATKVYQSAIKINNVFTATTTYHSSDVSVLSIVACPVSDIRYLAIGDYVELFANVEAGVNTVDIYGNTTLTFLSIHKLS